MAVYSMTGYANASASACRDGCGSIARTARRHAPRAFRSAAVSVEMRSVNGRFLDLALRLPDELRGLEPALRELLTGALQARQDRAAPRPARGDAESAVAAAARPSSWTAWRGSRARSSGWLPERARRCRCTRRCNGAAAARRPRGLDEAALDAARRCVDGLREARAREGARLVAVLLERVDAPARAGRRRPSRWCPAPCTRQQQRFLERWQRGARAAPARPQSVAREAMQERALNEAAAYAIRIDVAEELARLRSHLDEIARLLAKGGEVGKRLDFLIQELLREANTLGSKSASIEMTDDLGRHEGRDRAAARAGAEHRVATTVPAVYLVAPERQARSLLRRPGDRGAARARRGALQSPSRASSRPPSSWPTARGCDYLIAYRQTPGPEQLFRELARAARLHPLRDGHPHRRRRCGERARRPGDAGERRLRAGGGGVDRGDDDQPRPRPRRATPRPATASAPWHAAHGPRAARLDPRRDRPRPDRPPPRRPRRGPRHARPRERPERIAGRRRTRARCRCPSCSPASDFVVCLAPAQRRDREAARRRRVRGDEARRLLRQCRARRAGRRRRPPRRARRRTPRRLRRSTSAAPPTRCRRRRWPAIRACSRRRTWAA